MKFGGFFTYLFEGLADLSHGDDEVDVGDAVDFAQHDRDELSALRRLLFNDSRVVARRALTAHETRIARGHACSGSGAGRDWLLLLRARTRGHERGTAGWREDRGHGQRAWCSTKRAVVGLVDLHDQFQQLHRGKLDQIAVLM